eukprot:scaffold45615_cov63-Phaeocystis_antarctica.AAC.1
MVYCGLVFLNALSSILSVRTVQPVHVGAVSTPTPPPEHAVPQPVSHSMCMLTGVPQLLQLFGTLKNACAPITRGFELYATLIVTMPSCLKLSPPSSSQPGVTSRQTASPPTFVLVTFVFAR